MPAERRCAGRPNGSAVTRRALAGSIAAIGIVLSASGCSVLAGLRPDPDTFDLNAPDVVGAQPVRRGAQILVAEPAALKAIDSENIVVEVSPFEIQYLGGAQWGDRLPRLVQRRLATAFDSADRFAGVGLPGQGLAIDYQIVSEIRQFGIDALAGAAEVTLEVKLLDDRTGNIVSDRTFSASMAVAPNSSNRAYIAALNAAFAEVAQEIVVWVTRRI